MKKTIVNIALLSTLATGTVTTQAALVNGVKLDFPLVKSAGILCPPECGP